MGCRPPIHQKCLIFIKGSTAHLVFFQLVGLRFLIRFGIRYFCIQYQYGLKPVGMKVLNLV